MGFRDVAGPKNKVYTKKHIGAHSPNFIFRVRLWIQPPPGIREDVTPLQDSYTWKKFRAYVPYWSVGSSTDRSQILISIRDYPYSFVQLHGVEPRGTISRHHSFSENTNFYVTMQEYCQKTQHNEQSRAVAVISDSTQYKEQSRAVAVISDSTDPTQIQIQCNLKLYSLHFL